jgi:hypothetical protein
MCSHISKKSRVRLDTESVVDKVTDLRRFHGDDFGKYNKLAKSFSLLLKAMRIWGLYFGCSGTFRLRNQTQEEPEQYGNSDDGKNLQKRRSVYATIVLVILWLNVVRFFLAFEFRNTFDSSTISQITFFQTFLQSAVLQTSYFIASRGGKLDQVFYLLNVEDKFAEQARRSAYICVVCNSILYLLAVAMGSYALFLSNGKFDFLLAPFVTHFTVDGIWLNVLKFMMFVVCSFVMQSWLWSLMMNLILTVILLLLLRQVNRRFRAALNRRGQFNGNLKTFRSRHQILIEAVQTADSFIRLGNVASIVCPMMILIVLLFEITIIGLTDSAVGLNFAVLFLMSVLDLVVCISSGVMVNNTVSHKKFSLLVR